MALSTRSYFTTSESPSELKNFPFPGIPHEESLNKEIAIDFQYLHPTPVIELLRVESDSKETCKQTTKKLSFSSLALIAAFTHAVNTFMAGITLMSLIEQKEPKSLGEIFTEGTGAASALTLSIGTLLGISSEITYYALVVDYIPRMKNDLLALKALHHTAFSKKKVATYIAAGLTLGAAIINSVIAWDTYDSIKEDSVKYPLALITSTVALTMTLAVRFVKMKQQIAESSYFYSPEEAFLVGFIKELEKADHTVHHNIHKVCDDSVAVRIVTDKLNSLFQERGLRVPNYNELETTVSHLLAQKFAARSHWSSIPLRILNGLFISLCTGIGAEIYSEKLAGLIPRLSGSWALPWDILRMVIGAIGASPHIATYYLAAANIGDFAQRTWETSRARTIGFMILDLAAGLSLSNVYLSIAKSKKKPPTIPLPSEHSIPGLMLMTVALLASNNINYESCANKFILSPPSAVGKELQELKDQIIEEKPVYRREVYNNAIKTIQSTLFKPARRDRVDLEAPLLEGESSNTSETSSGCWTRFRNRVGM